MESGRTSSGVAAPSPVANGLIVGGLAAAASLAPTISARSPLQQGIVTGVSLGAGYLLGSGGGKVTNAVSGVVPGGAPVAYSALTAGGLALHTWSNLAAEPGLARAGAGSLGTVMAVAGGAGLATMALRGANHAIADSTHPDHHNAILDNAPGVLLAAAAIAGTAVVLHRPNPVTFPPSRVVAQAAEAFEASRGLAITAEKPALLATVAGGPDSLISLEEMGKQGRRFVHEAMPAATIDRVLGETGAVDPKRVYAGLASADTLQGRVDKAIAEAERLGYFDGRSKGTVDRILLATPTGSGFVDPPSVQAEEIMMRGRMGSISVQYNDEPSVVSQLKGKTKIGAEETKLLMQGVMERVNRLPEAERPDVVWFGESLGNLARDMAYEDTSVAGLQELGLARSLGVGVPQESRFEPEALRDLAAGNTDNPGVLREFDRIEEYDALTDQQKADLRFVELAHRRDPVHSLNKKTIWFARPSWMPNGRGVPVQDAPTRERFFPGVSGLQSIVDLLNGTHPKPGVFEAHSHDYRADLPEFVRVAFGHADPASPVHVTPQQVQSVTNELVGVELKRSAILKADPTW